MRDPGSFVKIIETGQCGIITMLDGDGIHFIALFGEDPNIIHEIILDHAYPFDLDRLFMGYTECVKVCKLLNQLTDLSHEEIVFYKMLS